MDAFQQVCDCTGVKAAFEIFMSWLPLVCAVAVPFVKILKGGNPVMAFLMMWCFQVLGLMFFSAAQVLIWIVQKKLGLPPRAYFPDPPGIVAMLFLGWAPSWVLMTIAMGIRKLTLLVKGKTAVAIKQAASS